MRRVDIGLVTVELFVKMFLSFQMMCTEGKSLNDSTRRWLQMIWLSSKSLHPSERQSWFSVDYVRTPAGHYRWFNTLYQAHIQVSRGLDFMRTLCASPTNAIAKRLRQCHWLWRVYSSFVTAKNVIKENIKSRFQYAAFIVSTILSLRNRVGVKLLVVMLKNAKNLSH